MESSLVREKERILSLLNEAVEAIDSIGCSFDYFAESKCEDETCECSRSFKKGDKVVLKDEFVKYSGKYKDEDFYSMYDSRFTFDDVECFNLKGALGKEPLTVKYSSGENVAFDEHLAWCPASWVERYEQFKPGDKVRLKQEFKKYADKSALPDDVNCCLVGIGENEVLTVSTTIGETVHFTKNYAWCLMSWVEKVENFEHGDKVRLKPEFRKYAGESLLKSDGKCGLHGVSSDDELEIKYIFDDGKKARFNHWSEPWCPVSWIEKVEKENEDEKEVLASDGLPIKVGEKLWFVDDEQMRRILPSQTLAEPFTVKRIAGVHVYANSFDDKESTEPWLIPHYYMKHEEPDSWEKLESDAVATCWSYWKCEGFECEDCPTMIEGKRPAEAYDVIDCDEAQVLDIVRRAKAIAERENSVSKNE